MGEKIFIAVIGLLVAIAIFAALTSRFEPEADQRRRIEQELPAGCALIDLGRYQSIDHLVIIDCASGVTANGVEKVWTGKIYRKDTFASFQEKDNGQ